MNNIERIGHVTSSRIHLLCAKGRSKSPITGNTWSSGALTYFEEKRIERKLGRTIDTGAYSRPAAWGNFLELIVFDKLGIEYKIESQMSTEHPDEEFKGVWSGSADLIAPSVKIGEIKCYQLKKFAQYSDAILKKDIQNIKDNFAQEYWQMVSNAIINKVEKAEAISFAPYESQLPELREWADNYEGADKWKYRFISEEPAENLALLKDKGHYQDINMFEFTVPQEDIEFLTEKVRLAKLEITHLEKL